MRPRRIWLLLTCLGAALASAAEPASPRARRFVLAIGQNAGDPGDEQLRYAEDDARSFRQVMLEVGSTRPEDAQGLYGATADQVRRALGALGERLEREARATDQVLVYVSSHADAGELHLNGTRLPVAELAELLRGMKVAVGILVLDSCRSGVATRTKGLVPVEGVTIQVDASDLRGRVVISSSGPDELSQESDELRGSYFTHHFVTALRGAGDASRDGQVSLQEAYAYAYTRTQSSTFATRGGVQRPAFHVDLKGHGELILSRLRTGRARLVLDEEEPGRWQVAGEGLGVAQVDKGQGPAELVLPPGTYQVRLRVDDAQLEGTVALGPGEEAVVRRAQLVRRVALPARPKGGSAVAALGVGATAATSLLAGPDVMLGAELRLQLLSWEWAGFDVVPLSLGYRGGRGARGVAFVQHELELRAGLSRSLERGRLRVCVGPELGALVVLQENLPDGSARVGLEGQLAAALDARWRLGSSVGLFASLSGALAFVRLEGGLAAVPRGALLLGVALEL